MSSESPNLTSLRAGKLKRSSPDPAVKGKRTARGVIVDGSIAAIESEFERVFADMDGQLGKACKTECERLAQEMSTDQQEGGRAWTALRAVVSL